MNKIQNFLFLIMGLTLFACSSGKDKKQNEIRLDEINKHNNEITLKSNKKSDLTIRPTTVLLTGNKNH